MIIQIQIQICAAECQYCDNSNTNKNMYFWMSILQYNVTIQIQIQMQIHTAECQSCDEYSNTNTSMYCWTSM